MSEIKTLVMFAAFTYMAIAAYSDTVGCQKAVVEAIFGEIPFKGKLPVELPSIG